VPLGLAARDGLVVARAAIELLASIQTEAAPLLFQILRVHVSLCMSVTTEPVENKIAGSLVLTHEASLIRGSL